MSPLTLLGHANQFDFYQFETPLNSIQLYEAIRGPGSFILQSSPQLSAQSRFDFLGTGKVIQGSWADFEKNFLEFKPNDFKSASDALKKILEEIPFVGGYLIQLDYDAVYQFESKLNKLQSDRAGSIFKAIQIESLLVVDHQKKTHYLIESSQSRKRLSSSLEDLFTTYAQNDPVYPQSYQQAGGANFTVVTTKNEYLSRYSQIMHYIAAGDIFQCNYSIEFNYKYTGDPFEVYKKLREINPSPFAAYVEFNDPLISCSPERLFKVDDQQNILTRPIAGTRPITGTKDTDEQHQQDLVLSDKEQAEHLMLIDLERNDLGRICKTGTVKVDEKMSVEKYSHVQHLVSNVSGVLQNKINIIQIFKALFPGGTITGVPKIRCMEIINQMELKPRGAYCGALGYLDVRGQMDFNILIRTMEHKNKKEMVFRTGSGIVADSQGESEFLECLQKAKALAKALGIEQIESYIR
jgi:anthranilate/para-aminobenzoate synthase component I